MWVYEESLVCGPTWLLFRRSPHFIDLVGGGGGGGGEGAGGGGGGGSLTLASLSTNVCLSLFPTKLCVMRLHIRQFVTIFNDLDLRSI